MFDLISGRCTIRFIEFKNIHVGTIAPPMMNTKLNYTNDAVSTASIGASVFSIKSMYSADIYPITFRLKVVPY